MNAFRSGLWAGVALFAVASLAPAARAQEQPPAGGQPPMGQPPMGAQPPVGQPVAPIPPGERDLPLPPPIRAGQSISVLAYDFPNLSPGDVGGEELARRVLTVIKGGMIFSGQYDVATFSRRSALIRKADADGILAQSELNAVYDAASREINMPQAIRVARLLRIQTALLGAIEAVEVNRAANSATATITVQLINSVTGEPIKNAAVSGQASGTEENSALELAMMAAEDAATRALEEFGIGAGAPDKEGAVVGLPNKIGSMPGGVPEGEDMRDFFDRHGIPQWVGLAAVLGILLSPAVWQHEPVHHLP